MSNAFVTLHWLQSHLRKKGISLHIKTIRRIANTDHEFPRKLGAFIRPKRYSRSEIERWVAQKLLE